MTHHKQPNFKTSVIGQVAKICEKYDIPNPVECRVSSGHIKSVIKNRAAINIWRESCDGVYNVKRDHFRGKHKPYHFMPRWSGRYLLLWRCGLLRFRYYWKEYNIKRKNSIECPFGFCTERDTYEHSLECRFNPVKMEEYSSEVSEDVRILRYLYLMDKERRKLQRGLI